MVILLKIQKRRKQICGTCEYYDIRSKMLDCMKSGIGMDEGSMK